MNPFHKLKPLRLTALVVLLFFFYLAACLQAKLDHLGGFWSGLPDIPTALLVLAALHFQRGQAALACGILGLVRGAFSLEPLFLFTILYLFIGLSVAYVKRLFYREHLFSQFILVFFSALVFYLFLAMKSWVEFSSPPLGRGISQSLLSSISTGILGCLLLRFFLRARKQYG